MATLEETAAVWHDAIRAEQDHCTLLIGKAEGQNLGHKLPNLSRRKIDDCGELPAANIFGVVMRGLRASMTKNSAMAVSAFSLVQSASWLSLWS
jgi:hypothetical protein